MPHNSTKKLKNQDLNTITDLTVKTTRISHKERVRTNKSSGARGRSMDSRFRNSKGHIHYKNLDDRPPFDLNTTIDGQEDFPIDEITGLLIVSVKSFYNFRIQILFFNIPIVGIKNLWKKNE